VRKIAYPTATAGFILLGIVAVLFPAASPPIWAAQDHGHWNAPSEAAQRENPVPATAESIEKGRELFMQNCVICHGTDARGTGPAAAGLDPKPADLVVMGGHHPDGDLAWKIEHGRGPMPGWEDRFSDTQIWHLVNYIQSLSKGGHGHSGSGN